MNKDIRFVEPKKEIYLEDEITALSASESFIKDKRTMRSILDKKFELCTAGLIKSRAEGAVK